MAFDDLDQAEQEEETREATSDAAEETAAADTASPADGATDTPPTTEGSHDDVVGSSATAESTTAASTTPNEPAFGFEEAKQRPLYARQSAWDEFEDALAIDVETTLRRNDVRDAPKRELHDAALRVLADHADEVADRVLQERGVER